MHHRLRVFLIALALTCQACGQPQSPAPAAALETASPGILVAFRETHPLGEAQALEALGHHDEAAALARAAISADPALADLCFERFTVGGAEIVLAPCAMMTTEERAAVVAERARQLALLPGAVYAEPNLAAEPDA